MEYTLKFTEQDMRVLNAALVELPFRVAAPVVKSINEQLAAAKPEGGDTPDQVVQPKVKSDP